MPHAWRYLKLRVDEIAERENLVKEVSNVPAGTGLEDL
jgi:hypothetical protein